MAEVTETQSVSGMSFNIMEFTEAIWELRDKRVDDWFLMSSPWPTLSICIFYIYLVKVLGPQFMRNRKPIDCKTFLLFYNAFQVLLSTYIFVQGLMAGWMEYSLTCQPVDYTEKGNPMLYCAWLFHLSKYLDFVDTFCFIARKKFNQVSLLHVYHHSIMPINVWLGVRFIPGGHGTFFGLINAFVHIVMYTYYLIAGLGPKFQKFLWWKIYVTKLQLTQFIVVLLHSAQLLFRNNCNYPIFFSYVIIIHATVFLGLFSEFYIKAYLRSKTNRKKIQTEDFNRNVASTELLGNLCNADEKKEN